MVIKNNKFNAKLEIKSKSAFRNWVWVVVFAIAFAWVESAVVVYLREIYFDGGFSFPLVVKWEDGKHIIDPLVRIEFGQIATVIMPVAVGWVAGRNRFRKFCFFYDCIWDMGHILLHLAVCHGEVARKPYDMGSFVLCAATLGRPNNHTGIDCACYGGGGLSCYLL